MSMFNITMTSKENYMDNSKLVKMNLRSVCFTWNREHLSKIIRIIHMVKIS